MCSMCHPTALAGTEPAAPAQGTGGDKRARWVRAVWISTVSRLGRGPWTVGLS